MASTVVKTERYSDIDENDPLAELSRIMGLEVKSQSDAFDEDDFGIDLEKELFAEAEAEAAPPFHAASTSPAPVYDDSSDAEFDAAFSDFATDQVVSDAAEPAQSYVEVDDLDLLSEEMDMALSEMPKAAVVEQPAAFADVVPAIDDEPISDAIDAFSAELEQFLDDPELPAATPTVEDFAPVAADGEWQLDDLDLGEEAAEAEMPAPVAPAAAAEYAAPAPEAEAAHIEYVAESAPIEAASNETDFEIAFDDLTVEASDEWEPEAPVSAEVQFAPDAEAELDAALADFENDPIWSDAPLAPAPQAVAEVAVEPHAEIETVSFAPEVASFDDAHDADIDALETELAAFAAPVEEPAPAQPVVQAEPRFQPLFNKQEAVESAGDDADPFAALAALAATPPIMKTLNRANPVSAPAVAERSSQPAPADRTVNSWPNLQRANPGSAPVARPMTTPLPVHPVAATAPMAANDQAVNLRPVPDQKSERPVFASANPYRDTQSARTVEPQAAPAPRATAPVAPVTAAPSMFGPASAAAPVAAAAPIVDAVPDLDFSEFDDLVSSADLAPEVDTVAIEEPAVALVDDFDIPELEIEEPVQSQVPLDDFENDFADAFNELGGQQTSWKQAGTVAQPAAQPAQFATEALAHETVLDADFASFQQELERDFGALDEGARYASNPDDFEYDADEAALAQAKSGRLPLFGAIFGGLALLVAGGVYAYSTFSEVNDGAPALVRADADPVKVKPEVPAGENGQSLDSKVYKQVAGSGQAAKPTQTALVSQVEEPIVPSPRAEALPGVDVAPAKSEERVLPEETGTSGASSEETAAIAPRKVRTMIVRADGTLVEREAPAAAAPAPA
ncbi:MAG: hypothetical protein WBF87_01820, partial [Mesorhizobium sp.]